MLFYLLKDSLCEELLQLEQWFSTVAAHVESLGSCKNLLMPGSHPTGADELRDDLGADGWQLHLGPGPWKLAGRRWRLPELWGQGPGSWVLEH